jgi:uncharacterized damage-inducible protein DinB
MADDEVLKNTFANLAFENFEIASYKSLIAKARKVGDQSAISALQQTLQEEQRMATWIDENVEQVTERYLDLKTAGQKAERRLSRRPLPAGLCMWGASREAPSSCDALVRGQPS